VRGHVSAEAMADFRAGLLPARKAAAISAHLSTCRQCAELDEQLASVTSLLAAAPGPAMPAELVARLDAALAAEVAARAAGTGTAGATGADAARAASVQPPAALPPTVPLAPSADALAPDRAGGPPSAGPSAPPSTTPPGTATPPGHRRPDGARRDGRGPGRGGTRPPSRLVLRLATAAAAIVLVAGGGYAVAQLVSGGTPATTAGPTAAGAPHSVTSPGAASQRTASHSAASGLAPAAQPAARLPVVRSGTRYRTSLLPAQVRSVLRRFAVPVPSPSAHVPGPVPGTTAFPQLAACVSRVAGAAVPRLVDIASYGGRPVAVIVVPVPGSSTVRVWLVGTACPAHGGDVIAHFSMPGTG
jgi:hypothetical protein